MLSCGYETSLQLKVIKVYACPHTKLKFFRDADGDYFRYTFYSLGLAKVSWPASMLDEYTVAQCVRQVVRVCDEGHARHVGCVVELCEGSIVYP